MKSTEQTELSSLEDIINLYYENNDSLKYLYSAARKNGKLAYLSDSLIVSFIETSNLTVVVGKMCTLTMLHYSNIKYMHTLMLMVVLIYVLKNRKDLLKLKLNVQILKKSPGTYKEVEYMNILLTLIMFDRHNPTEIDSIYAPDKKLIKYTKKSPSGTFFGVQSSKYFKEHKDTDVHSLVPIEVLKGKRGEKNYLLSEKEIIVLTCPVCHHTKKFTTDIIEKVFMLNKGNEVAYLCNHPSTDYEHVEPYTFNPYLSSDEIKKYTRVEIFMYIVNNRKYFGFFRNN